MFLFFNTLPLKDCFFLRSSLKLLNPGQKLKGNFHCNKIVFKISNYGNSKLGYKNCIDNYQQHPGEDFTLEVLLEHENYLSHGS